MLPVEPIAARVIAHDAHGRPALLGRDVGAGRLLLATYPIEYFAARTPRVNPDDTVRLYRAAAVAAGAEPVVSLDDSRVLIDVLEHADGRRFAIAVSQVDEPLTTAIRVSDARLQASTAEGETIDTITLDPYEAFAPEAFDSL